MRNESLVDLAYDCSRLFITISHTPILFHMIMLLVDFHVAHRSELPYFLHPMEQAAYISLQQESLDL